MIRQHNLFHVSPVDAAPTTGRGLARLFVQATSAALLLVLATSGCESKPSSGKPSSSAPAIDRSAADGPLSNDKDLPKRSTVELTDATCVVDEEGIARFQIHYRFTAGRPRGYYLVTVAFPGTEHQGGTKPMEAYELKHEGTIVTAFEVGNAPIDAFEITMAETDSPDQGFTPISEPLKGNAERPADAAKTDDAAKAEPPSTAPEAPAN